MATFLALCQRAASESGMMGSGITLPTTVVGQTGDEGQIVRWVQDAWRRIQTSRSRWRWMQGEFTGLTVAAQRRYAASDFSLTRFSDWLYDTDSRQDTGITSYLQSAGQAKEGSLRWLHWEDFYRSRLRGGNATLSGAPNEFTVDPQMNLTLHAIPDAVYVISGRYVKSPQELTADADVPEMPERFHDLIWMGALLRVGSNQESFEQYPVWRMDYGTLMTELERDQLPRMKMAALF